MAVRRVWNMLKTAIAGFGRDDVIILSAALAPLLILLVTGTSLTPRCKNKPESTCIHLPA
jgi:hypothetical protein